MLLFDATPSVLGAFPQSLSKRAAKDLGHLGVDVELSAPVTEIDADGLTIGSGEQPRHIPAKTVIWAAGDKASPLAALPPGAAAPSSTRPDASTSSPTSRSRDTQRCSRSGT